MRPLDIINASEITEANKTPIVLNTSFCIIKTWNKKSLSQKKYVPDEQLQECEKSIHFYNPASSFTYNNVVIIIVESLSKEYISFFNGKSKTPFLDSLFGNSFVFENGFANAKESIQGIPAILASIPSWQDNAFIFSNYASNSITSVATLLKQKNYSSYFFHGGSRGTMGFNLFSQLAGFDRYYAREDYNNEKDFDGTWGIWDEPFLQFMGSRLNDSPKPFVSVVFTLNTHHPFTLPKKYNDKFKQPGHPILSCMQYADFSLSRFFNTIQYSSWFKNTLFIITADHTGPNIASHVSNLSDYRIPIVFYKPDNSLKGVSQKIANQIDILPSIMHLLNYPLHYFSFGKDLFTDQCTGYSINYNSGIYQYIDSSYCYQFNGEIGKGLFNWKTDPYFERNLINGLNFSTIKDSCDKAVKKSIQVFNNAMINNKMTYTSIK